MNPVSRTLLLIRPVRDDADMAAFLDVRRRIDPRDEPSAEQVLHFRSIMGGALELLAWLGEEPAGFGTGVFPGTEDDSHVTASFGVLPELRRRGIGSALHQAISEHARALGKDGLQVEAREDYPDAVSYLEHRGYVEVERQKAVALDLRTVEPSVVDPPPGIEITTRARRPDLLRGMYEVALEANRDIPGLDSGFEQSFEEWRSFEVESPGRLPELCFIALAGEEVVGYASLDVYPGAVFHGLTAVKGVWRRRGIASALKRAEIAAAKEAGFEQLITESEERNVAMRRLNEQLGYRPVPGMVVFRGPLL